LKILFVAQEPELERRKIVSGNAVRIDQLSSALQGAGHSVVHVWLARPGHKTSLPGTPFRSRDQLQGIILSEAPDVVFLTYWELAALLPFGLRQPVVLDFIAPRPLEELYESPGTTRSSLRRLRMLLQRCDLLLVGNEQQRHLLVNTLIEAGFDLRGGLPVLVVPLGANGVARQGPAPDGSEWILAAGGVAWPWRNTHSWMRTLAGAAQRNVRNVRIVQFEGTYPWHEPPAGSPADPAGSPPLAIEVRALQPYEEFSAFLATEAHIGVELADWNVERAYSQSFRSLEFLRHGLPVLCNSYLPLAPLVREYNAGWLVESPEQLEALLDAITEAPEAWLAKSAGAQHLVAEVLQPARSVAPLIEWLESPVHAPRLPAESREAQEPPVLGVPPWRDRLFRQWKLLKHFVMRRLFGQRRSGHGILFVTRGDLFPADHGAAVRIVETARALAGSGTAVGIVTDAKRYWYEFSDGDFRQRRFPLWVPLFSLPAALVKLLHYSKDLPLSNSFLYLPMTDGGFFWRTLAAGRKLHAGILQAEFPAYARPCIKARDLLDCRVVLVEHNVEYERLRAQVTGLTDSQYRNLKQIELGLCRQADAVVCVSDNDRQILAGEGLDPEKLHTIVHGVDLSAYRGAAIQDIRRNFCVGQDEVVLVFHGTFSYPPNQRAILAFAEILLPGLEKKGLCCHVLAVGKDPPPSSPHRRIHFTGSVDDIASWLKAADLAVVPLTDGGGTRMKIIDCFAAGLPVISTQKGIEGIPVEPGRQAIVTDDWEEMMDAIVSLWRDPRRRAELADAGAAIAAGLDWSEIARRYRALYSTLR